MPLPRANVSPATRRELFQLIRFGAVGAVATGIHAAGAGVFLALRGDAASAVAANLAGFCCAFLWSFLGNTFFVFRYPGSATEVFPRFALVSAVTFALAMAVSATADRIGLHPLAAIAAVVVLIPIASYLGNRWWVFRASGDARNSG